MTATNMNGLRELSERKGDEAVKYAAELYALLKAVGAVDCPEGQGAAHAIYVGPPGNAPCLFRGRLSITRQKILPQWKNAYELALEATIEHVHGEKRNRDSRAGQFVISWLEK